MNIHTLKKNRLSLLDFEDMLFDRPEDEKWELINGVLVKSMVGAHLSHHRLIRNLDYALNNHFRARNKPCEVFRETFFLKEEKDDLAALPDIMVHCGKPHGDVTSINDPVVLIEVMSPGSVKRDTATKRIAYQHLPSLQHYVMIDRDEVFIEVTTRREDGWMSETPVETISGSLRLPALEFEMSVADVYKGVIDEEGEGA